MRGGWRRWTLWGLQGGGAGCETEVVSVVLVKGEGRVTILVDGGGSCY